MFKNCAGIESIVLPSSVTEMGTSAFEGCASLSSVSVSSPSKLETIGECAFKNCSALAQIEIPGTVTTIGRYAFENSGLTSITVPATVTSLGDQAFSNCQSLESANIYASIEVGPSSLFLSCKKLTTVTLPSTLTSIGYQMFRNCYLLSSVEIPDGVTTLGKYSFADCRALTSIDLPSGLQTIEDNAFNFCIGLTGIEIPDSVTTIGSDAFMDCRSLETVHIGKGLSLIGKPGDWANKTTCFIDCWALKNLYVDDGNEAFWDDNGVLYANAPDGSVVLLQYGMGRVEDDGCYEILSGVTRIGANAVYTTTNKTLTTLIIPVSVTEMGDNSLNSTIKNIYYKGTEEQWSAISKRSSSYSNKTTITYNYTDQ